MPRSRTSTIACSALMAPDGAGRGQLADAVAGDGADAGATAGSGSSTAAVARPVATSSGWAIWVSRMVSASASVP